jgi:hypothetical protein
MPKVTKYKDPIDLGSFFIPKTPDSPIKSILAELDARQKIEKTLELALQKMGLEQFAKDISIGEINDQMEINLLAQKATIITKLKNKLPSLLNFFRESGFPLRGIHLKVSPRLQPALKITSSHELTLVPMNQSSANKKAWTELMEDLDEDSPVRGAVHNLLKKIN